MLRRTTCLFSRRRFSAATDLLEIDAQLEQIDARSPMTAILKARRAAALAEQYRLYESRDTLMNVEPRQQAEVEMLGDEIEKIEAQMLAHASLPNTLGELGERLSPNMPYGVAVLKKDSGQLGLMATMDFDEGSMIFTESPLAVASENGCLQCMRPLKSRRVLAEGQGEISNGDGESLLRQCGLEPLELRNDDDFCSDKCRQIGGHRVRRNSEGSLLAQVGSEEGELMRRHLWPAGASLERLIETNAMEISTHGMAALLHPTEGIVPIADYEYTVEGSAIYLIASLLNHSCNAPNVAPVFLDSLDSTPFVALADICKGDELTFDYASTVADVRDKRIRNFFAHGFVCKC